MSYQRIVWFLGRLFHWKCVWEKGYRGAAEKWQGYKLHFDNPISYSDASMFWDQSV
jgi:hypothetical protein